MRGMTARQRFGAAMIASAVVAGIPNYLWLIGVVTRPDSELMASRWLYEGIMAILGFLIGWGP